jgi:hypothetical protein
MIAGVVLFLYGANYFNAVAGWSGVALAVGGFVAEIALKLYEVAVKKGD